MRERQQVIDTVNHSWTKDLIIRYLYIKLAPFFERDLEFFFADEETQLEYVRTLPRTVGREIICLSLCQFIMTFLSRLIYIVNLLLLIKN